MNRFSLRARILIPLTLTFAVLLAGFLYNTFATRKADIEYTLNREHSNSISMFKELLSFKTQLMAVQAAPLLTDPILRRAMRRHDRPALLTRALELFPALTDTDITHWYFHTPDAQVFLRVHQPELHGDRIGRRSLQEAIDTGQPASSLELGPFGTLAQRLVIPWRDTGGLLGYLELGAEASHILNDVAMVNNIDFILLLDKELLKKQVVDAGAADNGRLPNWNDYPDRIVAATSLEAIPLAVNRQIKTPGVRLSGRSPWQQTTLGNRSLAYKSFSLALLNSQTSGTFILFYDITRQTERFYRTLTLTTAYAVLFCLVLYIVAWRILGSIEQKISSTQQELEHQAHSLQQANRDLEQEVAERTRAEQALAHLNANLEEIIAQRTQHLEAATGELERQRQDLEHAAAELDAKQAIILHQDKMAGIGLLAAGVAHEINNPIGFVTNNLEELQIYLDRLRSFMEAQQQMLETTAPPQLLADLQKKSAELGIKEILDDYGTLIAESLDGTGRVGDIVKNLRSFSRVDDMEFAWSDINDCLERAVRITSHELRYKAVVHRQYGTLPLLWCRPQQLNQVFMNLLINASHAIEQHGEVTITTWADETDLYVSIADTGCGIPEEMLDKIFKPFFTTKETGIGTGLGLSIVADIIDMHHGGIEVCSSPGAGTVFTVRLPLREEGHHA